MFGLVNEDTPLMVINGKDFICDGFFFRRSTN